MTTIITISNQKGGVGKTRTAVDLAHGLTLRGKEVLLIDVDPQGSCATALGLNPEPGAYYLLTPPPGNVITVKQWVRKAREQLWLIPGDISTNASQAQMNAEGKPLSHIADQLKPLVKNGMRLDYVIFDTAPSVGGIQERAIWASDLVLIPAATEFLAADGTRKILTMMMEMQKTKEWRGKVLGILPTFFDEQTRESKAQMEEYRKVFGTLLMAPIHRATILRECPGLGRTIFEVEATTDAEQRAVQEYQAVVEYVLKAR